MTSGIYVFALCVVIAVCCLVLVFHCHYEDGLFGRLGLVLIFGAAFVRGAGILEAGFDITVSRVGVLLWTGLALFLTRHLWRFLRWRRSGRHAWREPDAAPLAGKVPR